MEILKTIWNILISENEDLTNLLVLPLNYVEAYLGMLIFTILLEIKKTKKQEFLYVFLLGTIGILSLLFIPSPYYTFINIFACFLLIHLVFKINILESILCELVMYFLLFLIITPLILSYSFIVIITFLSESGIRF